VIALVTMNGCGIVSLDWQSSAEGETILQHFYDPQTTGRKVLGIYIYIHVLYERKCRSTETRLYCPLIRIRSRLDMQSGYFLSYSHITGCTRQIVCVD
jgi:hypothetical protein